MKACSAVCSHVCWYAASIADIETSVCTVSFTSSPKLRSHDGVSFDGGDFVNGLYLQGFYLIHIWACSYGTDACLEPYPVLGTGEWDQVWLDTCQ